MSFLKWAQRRLLQIRVGKQLWSEHAAGRAESRSRLLGILCVCLERRGGAAGREIETRIGVQLLRGKDVCEERLVARGGVLTVEGEVDKRIAVIIIIIAAVVVAAAEAVVEGRGIRRLK